MPENQIERYIQEVKSAYQTGHAREHAYRPALERLMSSFPGTIGVNDPKRSEFGNPDFIFLKRSNNSVVLGYAEAKDIDTDLDRVEKTNQLHRYAGYDNLFLTNSLEFRFYKNGEKYQTIGIGAIDDGQIELDSSNFSYLENELKAFLEQAPEKIKSGKRLALIMGAKARRIRDNVSAYLDSEDEKSAELEKIYNMIKSLLVHDLSHEKFADMYAQTLVYGLFVARYNDDTPASFTRQEARDLVPDTNPFLREFFDHIVGPHFDKRLAYIVDELCEVFSVSDVKDIVHKHLKLTDLNHDGKDPIIHFYEDFLKEYDPEERKKMGAYYTPIPVVRFIVRQVDKILKEEFGLAGGLADTTKKRFLLNTKPKRTYKDLHRVQILDPAVGTATFLNEIIKYIYAGLKGQEGRWLSYAEQELVPRLYGFELMMAPYTIAHLKLGMTLQETGVENLNERLGLYLTNTLEEGIKNQLDMFSNFGLAGEVTKEAALAAEVKDEKPIMVIVGNPPYSGESSNKTDFALDLVNKYKVEPGGKSKLQERNPKWINDDYVKFIAFAEEMIEKNGEGIVAMITNHAYLDNPTFRGMRWHFSETFDKIYILDLHGNAKKKEVSPDGGIDENVFDIMQGVAILLAVKRGRSKASAQIYLSDLYGPRTDKFAEMNVNKIPWQQIKPDNEMFYFKKEKDSEIGQSYREGIRLSDLFSINSVGVVTGADKVLIAFTEQELVKNLEAAKSNQDKRGEYLATNEIVDSNILPIDYRLFDSRLIYFESNLIERTRLKVMKSMIGKDNYCLVTIRRSRDKNADWSFVFISALMTSGSTFISSLDINYVMPLYTYDDSGNRYDNFNRDELKRLMVNIDSKTDVRLVFDYIYATLHSTSYREKYKEFLKMDFPRVPIPNNDQQFRALAELGGQLRELHLMNSSLLETLEITYPEQGSNIVEDVKYWPADTSTFWKGQEKEATVYKANTVTINKDQYFGSVPEAAWNFYIGGYQPAQKWLKDRKGRTLTNDDIVHYQKIIKALIETDRIMKEIDKVWKI
ncbi:N-6 DNA methylase [Candidatus Saccharibacteria bacterium]|nr:N-6 DNA methylase [Candidatus Saccharibacteria bacterium]